LQYFKFLKPKKTGVSTILKNKMNTSFYS